MSTFTKTTSVCAVCGEKSSHNTIMSTNCFGSPDLDLRPSEMKRSTMPLWLEFCPNCGYVASSISKRTNIKKERLASLSPRDYGLPVKSKLCERFLKQYLISVEEDNFKDAIYSALHAAWTCDDLGEKEAAAECRLLSLDALEKYQSDVGKEDRLLLRMDLLRRTGQFEKLIGDYEGISFGKEPHDSILDFQLSKAKNRDSEVYRISDAEDWKRE